MNLKEFKKKLLTDPGFKKEYYRLDLSMEISLMVQGTRMLAGVSQSELAKRVRTKQPSIARLENGKYLPSLGFLKKIAEALNTYLIPPKLGIIEEFDKYIIDSKAGKIPTKTTDLTQLYMKGDFDLANLLTHRTDSVGTNNFLN